MKWIHFSDIHFNFDGYDTSQMRYKLLEYLQKQNNKKIDAMFITGDFRFAPQKVYIEETKVFIDQIRKQCGIIDKPFYYTAGNHDVDRDFDRMQVIRGVRNSYKSSQGNLDSWKMLQGGFSEFNNFIEDSTGKIIREENPHKFIKNEKVNIICMNTAVTSGENSENEYGQLIVGIKFLEECLKKIDKSKPTIVYGHHSIESLNYQERVRVLEMFQNYGIHIYLCGHNHVFSINNVSNNEQYKIYEIFSGNLYTEEGQSQCGFLIADLMGDVLKIECHEWDFNNRKWHISNTYSDEERCDQKILYLSDEKLPVEYSGNDRNISDSALQKIMQFNSNNVAVSVPTYKKKFHTNVWPVVHKLEYEYTLKLLNAIGLSGLNIETDYNVTYPYSEIHVGGPTVNLCTYRYISNYVESYKAILQERNIPKNRIVDKNFIIKSNRTGFSVVDENNKRIEFCRADSRNDIGMLVRIKINEKKTVHLVFGIGKRGTMVAINYLINYAEKIYENYGSNNYFFCIWGNYIDSSIDTSKNIVDLSYLLTKQNRDYFS